MAKKKALSPQEEAERRVAEALANGSTTLDLSGLGLSEWPENFAQLTKLQSLNLFNNQLSVWPENFAQLTKLQSLNLFNNQLSVWPENFAQLTKLQSLYLSNNRLSEWPENFKFTRILMRLYLNNNKLTSLPDSLPECTQLGRLFLHGNPELGLPPEVLGPTWQDVSNGAAHANPAEILAYYFKLKSGSKPLNEVKLILIGRGTVGKTSLVDALQGKPFDKNRKETRGIKISPLQVTVGSETVRLHTWDFGGQEIMHATHQFFLTERSLYLVVISGREGKEDDEAEYWLKFVTSFGGDSPVIVVLNKIKAHPFDLNRGKLQEKYPQIVGFVETDCKGRTGISTLERLITKTLKEWNGWRVEFPSSWFAIKDAIAKMKQRFLSFDEFKAICSKNAESTVDGQKSLATNLHKLGIALNYSDDTRLRDTHVLKPQWVTGGVYKVINSKLVAKQNGDLHAGDLERILKEPEYPAKMHVFILDMMRKFDLWFPFPDQADRYLIPQLLSKQQPKTVANFRPCDCLGFEYRYEQILPEGILPRFIVRTHSLSEGNSRWRSGVILSFEGCEALVRSDEAERKIQVLIKGPEDSRRRLLTVIRADFDTIHRAIKDLKVTEWLGDLDSPRDMIAYDRLQERERQNIREINIYHDGKYVKEQVKSMLDSVDLPRSKRRGSDGREHHLKRVRLFCSYSHKDEHLRNRFDAHLKIFENTQLIEYWADPRIKAGEEWNEEIEKNLKQADVIVFLMSANFFGSKYINEKELFIAFERYDAGTVVLIPILVRSVNYERHRLSKLQALPGEGGAVDDSRNKEKTWKKIFDRMQPILESVQETKNLDLPRLPDYLLHADESK